MKIKKKELSLLIAAVMLVGMLPMGAVTVMADGDVSYRYYDNGTWYDGTKYSSEYNVVTNSTTSWNDSNWYVVNSDVTIISRISVSGTANLILVDGCTLTASSGITVNSSATLNIYGQTNNSGKLVAKAATYYQAGIGGSGENQSSGTIRIDGGTIEATGGDYGAGIGGGYKGTDSNITINGGTITATGGSNAAGIGGGRYSSGQNITINGGAVTAKGGNGSGAGIGGGNGGTGSYITINGGTVTAIGGTGGQWQGGGAGIGGGRDGGSSDITINGGTVMATGGTGYSAGPSGIGGGNVGVGNNITINGGTVEATGGGATNGNGGAGIGGGGGSNGKGDVTINSGTVKAIGGAGPSGYGAGIGGGGQNGSNNTSTVQITGGYISATAGGSTAEAIGRGTILTSSTNSPTVTITGRYFASSPSNSTLGEGGAVYSKTVANGYSVCDNTESTKGDYPYLVCASDSTVTITWNYGDNSTETLLVKSGSTITAPTDTDKASDGTYIYTLSGWSPEFSATASATVTYTAVYTKSYIAPTAGVGYTISYTNETATAVDGYEISTDGNTWESDTSIAITPSGTLYVRRATDSTANASSATTNTLASRLDTPTGISGKDEVWNGENDGEITGVSTEMEYQADGDTSWTACNSDTISGLAAGTYYVRYKATDSYFASNAVTITIASGTVRTYSLTVTAPTFDTVIYGYDQPDEKSITIENSGNSDATIESITVDPDDFIITTGDTTVTVGGTNESWTIQPNAGLSGGTHTSTITVTYDNEATATATVTFVVTPTYTLTVDLDGGSGDTDGGVYEEDTVIDIDAGSRSNYTFTGWTSSDGGTFGDASSASTTFTMPASDTTITANWQKKSSSSSGGSSHSLEQVTSSSSSDDSDDDEDTTTDTTTDTTDVTDTTTDTTTDTGTSNDTTADTPVIGSGDAAGTDVSDDAVFIDVSTSDPYYDAVMTAYENGLMVGIGDRLFAPDMHLTRAMAAQVIWNMAGTPGANDVAPFLDVTSDTWYAEAVAWCYENGIVVGYDDITYGPDDYLTEEQFERMLDIYKGLNPADYTGISVNATRSWVAVKITA